MFKVLSTAFAATFALSMTVVSAKPISGSLVACNFEGTSTYYDQGGLVGACGQIHQDSDFVIALPASLFDGGSHCGQTVVITDTDNGITRSATVADICPGCGGDSIDMSIGLFTSFVPLSVGLIPVSWNFS